MSYIYINTTNYYSAVKGGCDVRSTAQAVVTGTLSVAERSYPTSKVRGRGREDPMPEGRRPRGVTPRPRSGAAAESTRLRRRRNSGEELPHIRGQGRRPGGATPRPHAQGQGGGGEEQPHVQGAVAARMQEGLEELSHAEGQEELL